MINSKTIIKLSKEMSAENLAKDLHHTYKDKALDIYNGILIYLESRQKVEMHYFYNVRAHLVALS